MKAPVLPQSLAKILILRALSFVYTVMTTQIARPVDEFRRLRVAYEEAFHGFSAQVRLLQSITSRQGSGDAAVKTAQDLLEHAQSAYRQTRDSLARFILSR